MSRLALRYKTSFKMNLAAFWAKQRQKTFQLCGEAPRPSHSERAGTEPSNPALLPLPLLLLDWSQLAQIWKVLLVLTRAWVCMLCETA